MIALAILLDNTLFESRKIESQTLHLWAKTNRILVGRTKLEKLLLVGCEKMQLYPRRVINNS